MQSMNEDRREGRRSISQKMIDAPLIKKRKKKQRRKQQKTRKLGVKLKLVIDCSIIVLRTSQSYQ